MAKDCLDHFSWNSKPIKIGSQATPCRMPPVPPRQSFITLVFVILFQVLLATVEATMPAAFNAGSIWRFSKLLIEIRVPRVLAKIGPVLGFPHLRR